MRSVFCALALASAIVWTGQPVSGATLFAANLTGSQEVPAVVTPGTGFGTVLLNDAQTMITVDETFANLTTPATASHIHDSTGGPGTSGPIVFPFTGVPAATSGSIPEQTFAITSAQVTDLFAGKLYFNVHTSVNPSGEIRGFINQVPEPSTMFMLGAGLAGLAFYARKRSLA
jgi:hypothetical protein